MSASCPVRELTSPRVDLCIRELSSPRVVQSASYLTASWFVGELSCHTISVAYSLELVLLNKHELSGGGAYLDCYPKQKQVRFLTYETEWNLKWLSGIIERMTHQLNNAAQRTNAFNNLRPHRLSNSRKTYRRSTCDHLLWMIITQ